MTATPDRIKKKKDTTRIDVTVSGGAGSRPPARWRSSSAASRSPSGSWSTATRARSSGPFPSAGTETVRVRYLGDQVTTASVGTTTLTVTNGNPK